MTSQQIREQCDISPRNEAVLWEIAYQLAVMNEQYGKVTQVAMEIDPPGHDYPGFDREQADHAPETAVRAEANDNEIQFGDMVEIRNPWPNSSPVIGIVKVVQDRETIFGVEITDGDIKGCYYNFPKRELKKIHLADHAPETAVRAEADTPHRTVLPSLGGSAPCVWCGLFTRYWNKVPVCPTPTSVEPLAAADHAPKTAVRAEANDADLMDPINPSEFPHIFEPLLLSPVCGKCGAGKLHAIHQRAFVERPSDPATLQRQEKESKNG